MIKNILLNSGYIVDVVAEAEEALIKLKMNHYDLIITDLTMPRIDGYQFVNMLKTDEMYADIPVIVMSSISKNIAMEKLTALNIDYYICKENFNQEEFVDQVRLLLTKYH
jgi:CheY-like chemotaxis protein